jgi:hypothetical protein
MRKFTEIYENPRGRAARAPCSDFLAAKNTKFSTYYAGTIVPGYVRL